jgi:hypothetical protein
VIWQTVSPTVRSKSSCLRNGSRMNSVVSVACSKKRRRRCAGLGRYVFFDILFSNRILTIHPDDQTRNCIETPHPLHHTSTSHLAHAIYLFLTLTIFFLSVNSNRHLKEAQDIILASACNRRRLSWLCSFYRTLKALIGVSSLWSCPSPLYPLLNALHIPQLVIILRVIRVR